jgi:hypothetical protein
MSEAAVASVHVVSLPWRQAWRGPAMVSVDNRLLRRLEGVRFAVNGRTCGGGGTRDINLSLTVRRQVVLVEWDSPAAAANGQARLLEVWSARGAEVWSASLVPVRATGRWQGATRFGGAPAEVDADERDWVASLTYAKVKASRLFDFYLRGFPKTARHATGPNSAMVAGIGFAGRLPIRQPCTVSFWRSNADVARFAYGQESPHGAVQRRARHDDWFLESMFVRFVVVAHRGDWSGGDPLAS